MGHIFISYSHTDSDYAHRLAEALEQRGLSVWIDERVDYGTQWPHIIQEHVDGCSALIVVMTQRSYKSEWVQSELARAKRKGKHIFPLLLEGDEPWLSVETTQYVDVRGGKLPQPRFFERLARMMGAAAAAAPVEEKTEFDVIIKDAGPKKIEVIKTVRQLTNLGLKEAKGLVDTAPQPVLTAVSKEAANDAKTKLEASGAAVEVK